MPGREEIPKLKSFVWRTLPLMVGLTLGFSSEFLLRRMAGYLGTGSVAEANYAFRLTMVLVAFFGQAAGVASYPYLVELAAAKRTQELNALLAGSLERLLAFLLPASVAAAVLAPELVAFAYQRGHFGSEAAAIVSRLFRIQVWCVLPWCAQIVFARALYARDRFWSSAVVGTLLVGISWPLWSLLAHFWGKDGASAGLVLLVGLEALGYAAFWMRSYPGEFPWRQILSKLPKPLLLSVMTGLLALDVTENLSGASSIFRLALAGTAAVAFYLVAGISWGLEELEPVRKKAAQLTSRLSRRA
jgi:putative peptidoglycan lipid II flippase